MPERNFSENTEVSAEPSACNPYLWRTHTIEFYTFTSTFPPSDLSLSV